MGLIILVEITNFKVFESVFTFIKTPSSWFVGLSLAYAFSNLFQKSLFSIFSKKTLDENKSKGDFFIGFIITFIITAMITPYIKEAAIYFFTNFFIYFNVILMQCVIILYLFFKLKEGYEISGRYLLTNELIVLFYTVIILYFIA
ncbi:MAG: hypothetical protein NTW17_02445 [Candidatus Pacearchaeota archaeon]|nr:hypothetical protein [Candidatus Pacearchaeota archaeon]